MQLYNIPDANAQLSWLGEQVANGKPMVKVNALNAPELSQIKPFGFMAGQIQLPDDFDRMAEAEICQLFAEGELPI